MYIFNTIPRKIWIFDIMFNVAGKNRDNIEGITFNVWTLQQCVCVSTCCRRGQTARKHSRYQCWYCGKWVSNTVSNIEYRYVSILWQHYWVVLAQNVNMLKRVAAGVIPLKESLLFFLLFVAFQSVLFLLSYSQTYSPSLSLWQCLTPYLTARLSRSHFCSSPFLCLPILLSQSLPFALQLLLEWSTKSEQQKKHTRAHKVKRYDSSVMVLGFDMSCLLSTPVFFLTSFQWTILCRTGCYRCYLVLLFSGKKSKAASLYWMQWTEAFQVVKMEKRRSSRLNKAERSIETVLNHVQVT